MTCGLLFYWRKKWERNWDHVKYCSERCRKNKNRKVIHWFRNDQRTTDHEVISIYQTW